MFPSPSHSDLECNAVPLLCINADKAAHRRELKELVQPSLAGQKNNMLHLILTSKDLPETQRDNIKTESQI